MHALLNDGLDKVLYKMHLSLIFATLYELIIIFRKESFIYKTFLSKNNNYFA